ncbi:hypothetical protein AcW1_000635 [Taiwanofungus camphoratus]|nr:hypothetical protein AcV7_000652 [Antrodia cinnamomea]KAI0963600.1 hypothetical protein AcW1_000635 [Antrodia cinnamomea]
MCAQSPSCSGIRHSQTFLPPPTHPSLRSHSSPASRRIQNVIPPELPRQAISDAVLVPHQSASDSTTASDSSDSIDSIVLPTVEEALSETQLREFYDDEEINRFLQVFSAYVREVRVPHVSGTSSLKAERKDAPPTIDAESTIQAGGSDDWEAVQEPVTSPHLPRPHQDRCLSDKIALDYVVPLLPPAPPPPPAFTLQRLKVTAQRIYLAIEPTYRPFFLRLARLATWQETNRSLVYCFIYWVLWYHNFLLPSLTLRILYALVRRKLFPYPTLAELREHRQQVDSAEEFSSAVAKHLVASPIFDVHDAWHLFRGYNHVRKLKKAARSSRQEQGAGPSKRSAIADEETEEDVAAKMPSESDDVNLKRTVLAVINETADVHERIKNIFLWRQPAVSLMYGLILVVIFFVSLLPTQYLCKAGGFICGIFFWHVVPIIVTIPPSDRARFPGAFSNVPTDADYAMELISQRVARGLDVQPKCRTVRNFGHQSSSAVNETEQHERDDIHPTVDWKKWGERAESAKARAVHVKHIFQDGGWKEPSTWLSLNPLIPKIAVPYGSNIRLQTYTFPAQYAKASGLITLTSDTLFFTSLLSSTAKLAIPLTNVLGVKKTGPMRGLDIHWMEAQEDGQMEEREGKFLWVGAQNELFARLVGWGGRRWAKV